MFLIALILVMFGLRSLWTECDPADFQPADKSPQSNRYRRLLWLCVGHPQGALPRPRKQMLFRERSGISPFFFFFLVSLNFFDKAGIVLTIK